MKITDLAAAGGEPFSFCDEDGVTWGGACSRLLPYEHTVQVDGEVQTGPENFIGKTITLIVDLGSNEANITCNA